MIGWGTFAGLCTGFATLIGALPLLFAKGASDRQQNVMIGFAAGVMLSASYLSLIVPAAGFARSSGHGAFTSAAMVALSVLIGAASLEYLRRIEPFKDMVLGTGVASPEANRRAWLLIIAMTSHNLPEGAAVGVGFGAGEPKIALSTALGIGLQNLPEGLAVAAALVGVGTRRLKAVLIGGATGIVEPIGAFLGVAIVSQVQGFLPFGMGWAAGAMLYICAAELIPSIHGEEDAGRPMVALMIGLATMLFLDVALS